MPEKKARAPRNRTLRLTPEEHDRYAAELLYPESALRLDGCRDRIFCGEMQHIVPLLPEKCVDLLILDPPYNQEKTFGKTRFGAMSRAAYTDYLAGWFPLLLRVLKPEASVYWCGDWRCSGAIEEVMQRRLIVRNRIVWQREKGRGAAANWKNSCEDIWFGTVGKTYYFDVDAVKVCRRVLAPYRENGRAKDWQEGEDGRTRLSCPGNFWDDITVPFWSMPENTDHPTQKPEKLLAKLILASSREGDVILDPFAGSGSTAVTAKKLGRHYIAIERDPEYCIWALARLARAEKDKSIQGYEKGIFYDRNF